MGQDMANTLPLQGLNPSHQANSWSFYSAILDHELLNYISRIESDTPKGFHLN
jgi:hypothetical protein